MSEQIKNQGEGGVGNLETLKYEKVKNALDEIDSLMKEINSILSNAPDRVEAEKLLLESHVPLMEEAQKRFVEAWREWFDYIKEQHTKERKESEDLESTA